MKLIKCCRVTLLEVLLVIAILSLISGLVSINIFKAVREQHFRTEVAQVVDYLRLAQNIMLIMNTDTFVKFRSKGDALLCSLEFEHSVVGGWARELKRPPKEFKTIHYVEFDDKNNLYDKDGEISIRFISHGSVMSRGVMTLSTADPKESNLFTTTLKRFIDLPGFPSPIQSIAKSPQKNEDDLPEENKQITTITYREIKELDQSEKTK